MMMTIADAVVKMTGAPAGVPVQMVEAAEAAGMKMMTIAEVREAVMMMMIVVEEAAAVAEAAADGSVILKGIHVQLKETAAQEGLAAAMMMTMTAEVAAVQMMIGAEEAAVADGSVILKGIPKHLKEAGKTGEAAAVVPAAVMTMMTMTVADEAAAVEEVVNADGLAIPKGIQKQLNADGKAEAVAADHAAVMMMMTVADAAHGAEMMMTGEAAEVAVADHVQEEAGDLHLWILKKFVKLQAWAEELHMSQVMLMNLHHQKHAGQHVHAGKINKYLSLKEVV